MKRNIFILSIGVTTLSACLTKTGSEGNLQMQYSHGYINAANTPVAVGLTAIASISDLQGNPIDISNARSNDNGVLSIQQIVDNKLYVQAETSGQINLTIDAGETGDVFILETEDIAEVQFGDLQSSVAAPEDTYIVAGSTVAITRTLRGNTGQSLTGFGLQGEISPATAGQWVTDDQSETIFISISEVGDFHLVYGESSKQYTAIDAAEITEWVFNAPESNELAVDQAFNISLYGKTNSQAVGLSNLVSSNEDVCTVEALLSTTEYFMLTTLSPGMCELSVAATGEPLLRYEIIE